MEITQFEEVITDAPVSRGEGKLKYEYKITCISISMVDEKICTYTFRIGEIGPIDLVRRMSIDAEVDKWRVGQTYGMALEK